MRNVIGIVLFALFVIFVGPTPLPFCISFRGEPGDPEGLLCFGTACAVLFGIPGLLLFEPKYRWVASGWLAFALMTYLIFIISILLLCKTIDPPISPENRAFYKKLTPHYGRIAGVIAVQAAICVLLLFRRKRQGEDDSEFGSWEVIEDS